MKIRFTLLLSLFFLFSLSIRPLKAQTCDPYYPMEKGVVFETSSYNDKGKLQSRAVHEILDKTGEGANMVASVRMTSYDKKGDQTMSSEYDLICKDGVFMVDMRNMMGPENMQSMQNMEVTVEADNLEFPADPVPGQTLPDAHLTVKMNSPGFSMGGMQVHVTNRKIGPVETVTTPAGTYECITITQDVESRTMGIKISASSKTWYARGVGMVRNESFNKKGKMMGYEELTRLER